MYKQQQIKTKQITNKRYQNLKNNNKRISKQTNIETNTAK